jgi:hypothetical protein
LPLGRYLQLTTLLSLKDYDDAKRLSHNNSSRRDACWRFSACSCCCFECSRRMHAG